MAHPALTDVDDTDYCRQIEAYLCQKNGGHLVRIVGPAFEKVCAWADQGVPLKVAFRGIDRCVERAAAKGGRRRPMRVEFCEADVLEAFDDWRRALGVTAGQVAEAPAPDEWSGSARKGSLPSHLERSVSRLLAARVPAGSGDLGRTVTEVTRELDALSGEAKHARGEARARILEQLSALDDRLIVAARGALDERTATALRREADAELAGFAGRMPADGLARSRQLAFDRLVRETFNLPVLTFE